jgi:DNA-binding PadR family transcriptional regulator
MKLIYTRDEIERRRDRLHHRRPSLAVHSKRQALQFINDVGYCFAFKSENSELPCLWHAACGMRDPLMPEHTHHDPYISFVWEMKDVLPAEGKIYYGKLLKRRPTMVSLEYLPEFYVLSGRTGEKDEFRKEFLTGRISAVARDIMETLSDSSPQVTRGLKLATGTFTKDERGTFDKAITELQAKMFIVKVAEESDPFSFVWAPFAKAFASQVRRARRITPEAARQKLLEQYFKNQFVGSVDSIQNLFRWGKQTIYQTLGKLVQDGVITPNVKIQGNDKRYYAHIER